MDRLRTLASQLIVEVRKHSTSPQAELEAARIRQEVLLVDGFDRSAVDALTSDLTQRMQAAQEGRDE